MTTKTTTPAMNDQQLAFECLRETTRGDFKALLAILDATEVLAALERSPSHHDTHPSCDIKTGAGYAHGRRVFDETLPNLMAHAHYLATSLDNEIGCFFDEQGIKP